MKSELLKASALAAAIKTRRADKSLRLVANEIGGISAATLQRVESGKTPDLKTLVAICQWLQVPLSEFIDESNVSLPNALSVPDEVEVFLRKDRVLPQKTIEAISEIIRVAYKTYEK